jgi:membrane fusion protein, multidrug efflux system
MKRRISALVLATFLAAGVWGCSAGRGEKAQEAGGRPEVAVEMAKASTAKLVEGIDVVGNLTPKYESDVKSEYPGVVEMVYVTEWARVTKGTRLAKLDTREPQLMVGRAEAAVEAAKANVLQAEASGNRADREHARMLKLKEVGLVTQQNVDDAATEREAASARIAAAKAHLKAGQDELRQMQTRLAKATLVAPMNGVVAQRSVNVGDMTGDKPLFRIVDNRLLYLTVTVPSKEMEPLRVGQKVSFTTGSQTGKTHSGNIAFINPAVSEADRSVRVIVEVPNEKEELKSGLFVKGRIETGCRENVLQIPRSSLLAWDVNTRKANVFIIQGGVVQRRTVGTGGMTGDLVEITQGLAGGDAVVARGAFNLKEGDRVKVVQSSGG